MAKPMVASRQPVLTKDWRNFIPASPSVITEASWVERNRLADKHYPQIFDLLAFGEDHLIDILIEVEQDEKPPREFRVIGGWLPKRSWLEWHLFRGIAPCVRRPAIPPHMRAAVIARDGYVCQLCGGDVEPSDVHLDHVVPFSRGGPTTVKNLQVTHARCNLSKGARI